MKHYYSLLIALVAMIALLGCSSKNDSTKQQPVPQSAQFEPPTQPSVTILKPIMPDNPEDLKLTAEEQKVFDFCDSSLALVARKSLKADSLLEFYRSHGIPARFLGDGQIKILSMSADSLFFFVFVNQSGDSTIGAQEAKIAATFSIPARSLGVEMCGFSKFIQGMMLSHELSHAVDCLMNHEPDSPPLSPDWLMGELRAHHATYTILNEFSQQAWQKAVRESREERLQSALAGGHSNQSFTIGFMPGDSVRVARFMKAIKLPWSMQDFNVLATWMIVDANLLNVTIVAGDNDQNRLNGMMMFLEQFYGQMMQKMAP
ncbi:MAG: hypothetical protein HZC01_02955 [Candidatus Kerfeldbacteria bacterium]|nr:hypothetical protein [Candidatus Kerfeldbacteria bacterium]